VRGANRISIPATDEPNITEAQILLLEQEGAIDHATWCNALAALRGEATSHLGPLALRRCVDAWREKYGRIEDALAHVGEDVKTSGDWIARVLHAVRSAS